MMNTNSQAPLLCFTYSLLGGSLQAVLVRHLSLLTRRFRDSTFLLGKILAGTVVADPAYLLLLLSTYKNLAPTQPSSSVQHHNISVSACLLIVSFFGGIYSVQLVVLSLEEAVRGQQPFHRLLAPSPEKSRYVVFK